MQHKPVLLEEIITALQPQSGGVYFDGTVGAGGHASAILRQSSPDGRLFGFDQDQTALAIARQTLTEFGDRSRLFHANFSELARIASVESLPKADGILFDLGVSSMQFDQAERGFSFQADGPLDMRMSSVGQSASDLVNELSQEDLANVIYQYGEERLSRRIARAIVNARPLTRTGELAEVVAKAVPSRGRKQKIHPATRTFQALRIAVNNELGVLELVLPQAIQLLKPAGRLAVISFHSLEDRIVKQYFKRESQDCICPPEQPICTCDHKATVRILTKRPVTPNENEIDQNPRARSAKLRVVELIKG